MQDQAPAGVQGPQGLLGPVVAQAPAGHFQRGPGGLRGRDRRMVGAGLQQRGPGVAAQRLQARGAGAVPVAAVQVVAGAQGPGEREPGVGVEAVLGAAGLREGALQQGDALGQAFPAAHPVDLQLGQCAVGDAQAVGVAQAAVAARFAQLVGLPEQAGGRHDPRPVLPGGGVHEPGHAVVAEHPGAVVAGQPPCLAAQFGRARAGREGGQRGDAEVPGEVVAAGAGVLQVGEDLDAGGVLVAERGMPLGERRDVPVGVGQVAAPDGGVRVEARLLEVHQGAQMGGQGGVGAQPAPGGGAGLHVVVGAAGLAALGLGQEAGEGEGVAGLVAEAAVGLRPVEVGERLVEPGAGAAAHLLVQPGDAGDGMGRAPPGRVPFGPFQDRLGQLPPVLGGDVGALGVEEGEVVQHQRGELGPAGAARFERAQPGEGLFEALDATVGSDDVPSETLQELLLPEVDEGPALADVVEQCVPGLLEPFGVETFRTSVGLGQYPVVGEGEAGPAVEHAGGLEQVVVAGCGVQDESGGAQHVLCAVRTGVVVVPGLLEEGEEECGGADVAVPFRPPGVEGAADEGDTAVPALGVVTGGGPLVQQPPEHVQVLRQQLLLGAGPLQQAPQLDLGGQAVADVLPGGPDHGPYEEGVDLGLERPVGFGSARPPGLGERGVEGVPGGLQFFPVDPHPAAHHRGEAQAVAQVRDFGGRGGGEQSAVVAGRGVGCVEIPVPQGPLHGQVSGSGPQVGLFLAARLHVLEGLVVPAQGLLQQLGGVGVGEAAQLGAHGEDVPPPRSLPRELGFLVGQFLHSRAQQREGLLQQPPFAAVLVLHTPQMTEPHPPGRPQRLGAGAAEGVLERLDGQGEFLVPAVVVTQQVQPVAQLSGIPAQLGRLRITGTEPGQLV